MTGLANWIVGGCLVFLYAHGRFHTPKTNVGSTTLFHFHCAACLYYGAQVVLFCFLSVVLSNTPEILDAMNLAGTFDADKIKGFSSPILAALLMTALLPNVPLLSKVDAWMLELFQDLGKIPREVRWWRDHLTTEELRIPKDAAEAIRKKLAADPRFSAIKEEDLRFEDDESPQYRFTRLIYLMNVVESFSVSSGKYPRVLEDFAEEYVAVRQQFEQAILTARRRFDVMAGSSAAAEAAPALVELKHSFREQCERTYRDICQLLARGILMSEPTRLDRGRKLEALGFSSFEETSAKLDVNQILTVLSVVFVIIFAGIALLEGQGKMTRALNVAVVAAVIYGAAIVCALAPKVAWRSADIASTGRRPVWAYVISGLAGGGCAIVLGVMYKSLMLDGRFVDAVRNLHFSWPWYLITICAAAALAFLSDNWGGRSTREPRWGRYVEGVGLALLLSGAFFLARAMVGEILTVASETGRYTPAVLEQIGVQPDRIPDYRFVWVTAPLGFVLGVLVPSWYRRMRTPVT